MAPTVSLLLPNRDNGRVLDRVLSRLAEHTSHPGVEVVAVDDGSTDDSRVILRRWRDSGRFAAFQLHERPPSGVVETLNHALHSASGEVCVQLDADASVETPGWVQRMLALLEFDPRVGAVTAQVVLDDGRAHALGVELVTPEGLHDRGTRVLEPVGRRTWHERVERFRPEHIPFADEVAEVDCGIGCCLMYRRADALAVGGYDLGFQPVWFDDLDLALSIRHRLGKKVFYLPDVRVEHLVHARRPPAPPRVRARQAVGRALPDPVREALGARLGLDRPSPEHAERLRHHYAYWKEKWGWDLLNPDMAALRERYAGTEVVWASEPERRAAGRHIAQSFAAGRAGGARAAAAFLERFGFLPPPDWSVLMDHAPILEVIRTRGLHRLDGDFVEIGVFLGGGTLLLARIAPERTVWAIDVFAPDTDTVVNVGGASMAGIYRSVLGEGDQRALFDAVAGGEPNVRTIAGDSMSVELPFERVAFAHVDGNHAPAYVRSDFERLWPKIVAGGVLAFDDYGFDLPEVTATIDTLRAEHAAAIAEFWTAGTKTAFLVKAQAT